MREANLQTDTKGPEPCEDAVSRKAVEEMLQNGFPARGMWEIEGDVVKQTVCETLADALMELEKLPSVTPKQKCGKWIYGEDEYGIDGYHCDKCGFFVPWDYTHKFINYIEDYNFCPSCGADMRGEQDE